MLTDKEIILKVKNGEIDYFSFIVKKYTKLIFNYVKNKIGRSDDAEDLTQNVFISFYKAIERFDENKPIKPYLYQIVSNELKMFYRSKKQTISLDEKINIIDEKAINFFQSFEKEEINFNRLNKQEKEMLTMIADGYSYQEVANKFKKKINTVKSIVRRARKKLLVTSC